MPERGFHTAKEDFRNARRKAVFHLGDVYFVSDGNQRVSVARELGHKTILADVTEVVKPARKIVERAARVDLVALHPTREDRKRSFTGFGTGFHMLICR